MADIPFSVYRNELIECSDYHFGPPAQGWYNRAVGPYASDFFLYISHDERVGDEVYAAPYATVETQLLCVRVNDYIVGRKVGMQVFKSTDWRQRMKSDGISEALMERIENALSSLE